MLTTGEFPAGGVIPNVGNEPAVIGAAKAGEIGTILPPVEGQRGSYLIKILSRTAIDTSAFNAQKSTLAAQLLQEKKQRVLSQWLEKLKETADIEDNRELFYR